MELGFSTAAFSGRLGNQCAECFMCSSFGMEGVKSCKIQWIMQHLQQVGTETCEKLLVTLGLTHAGGFFGETFGRRLPLWLQGTGWLEEELTKAPKVLRDMILEQNLHIFHPSWIKMIKLQANIPFETSRESKHVSTG